MHKFSNFTGQARHVWDKSAPAMGFGMSRSHQDMPVQQPIKRSMTSHSSSSPGPGSNAIVTLSFNVPFNSSLAGPDRDDVLYSSYGATQRWCFAEAEEAETDSEDIQRPTHELPIHVQQIEDLRSLCEQIQNGTGVTATVVCAEPKPIPGYQRGPLNSLVTNVCLYGEHDSVQNIRGRILTSTPISLVGNSGVLT